MNAETKPETGQPYWHLTLHCPQCGSTGVIPWDRLDRVFSCRACETWYRTDAVGQLVRIDPPAPTMKVAVRSAFSDWNEHQLAQRRGWRAAFWRRRGTEWVTTPLEWLLAAGWPTRLALSFCLLGLLASAGWLANHSTAAPAAVAPLPDQLEERAKLLALSWISRDAATLRRLTLPENSRELQHWSARTLRPSTLAAAVPADLKFVIESVVKQPDPKSAVATVRVARREGADAAKPAEFVQRQIWNQRGNVWYFCPRDVQAQQPTAQPNGKRPTPVPPRRRGTAG